MVSVTEMDYDEMVVTAADYWSARLPGRARWAIATTVLACAYRHLNDMCIAGPRSTMIEPGDVFFVTGDQIPALVPAEVVLCASCADHEIPNAVFGID